MSTANDSPDTLPQPPPDQEEVQERRPKFEPILDQPEPITLGENFWNNGKSWGYNVTHCGIDKVWFVKKAGNSDLSGWPVGQQLLVCLRKKDPVSWPYLEVRQAVFEDGGSEVKINPTEEKRKIMRERYVECLADAMAVGIFYDEMLGDNVEHRMTTEDIRQIATHFSMHREKKNF